MDVNRIYVNFVGGEISPLVAARCDIGHHHKSCVRMQNFVALPQGPAVLRPGTTFINYTRRNKAAWLIPFQFSNAQSYLIEATDQYFRFYKDGGIIVEDTKTITGISSASPGVVTSASHGYASGDEIYVSGVGGTTELNNRWFLVVKIDANTFSLTDVDGNAVSTTGYGAYTSGGTAARVYEMVTPYLEADISRIQWAHCEDAMYLVHPKYFVRRLVRGTTETSWTLSRANLSTAPALFDVDLTVSGITKANPGVLTTGTHGLSVGDHVYIDGIVGMTELNNRHFLVNSIPAATTFSLKTLDGVVVNTSGYTAYSSGGKVTKYDAGGKPSSVTFVNDGRLLYGGTTVNPSTFWGSKGPTTAGAVQYDDFATGSAATDGLKFTLATTSGTGKVENIQWMTETEKFIIVGTNNTIRRVFGDTEQEAIKPTSIKARASSADGVAPILPVVNGSTLVFVRVDGKGVESFEFDYTRDGYRSMDLTVLSPSMFSAGITQLVRTVGRPTIIWALRSDGVLLGLTYFQDDQTPVFGWHRHIAGKGSVESIGVLPRDSNFEQLWIIVNREVNGITRRCVEAMDDPVVFPDMLDFDDTGRYLNALWEAQKGAAHLDSKVAWSGAQTVGITLSSGAATLGTTGVTVTADSSVFTASMVGREIWGAYDADGVGGGRLEITGFTSDTVVTGTVKQAFSDQLTFTSWFLTATTLSGLGHLEGENVTIVADGAVHEGVVADGEITLQSPASKAAVGFAFTGLLGLLPLSFDSGGRAMYYRQSITQIVFDVYASAALEYGTDLNDLSSLNFRHSTDPTDRAVPLYTGAEKIAYTDSWGDGRTLYLRQTAPLPTVIRGLDIYGEVFTS